MMFAALFIRLVQKDSRFLSLLSKPSTGTKLRGPVRIIFGTTISQAELESCVVRCSINGAEATTGTSAIEEDGFSIRGLGPVDSIKSKWENSVTQVTAKWKSLG
jgi:hypothetical protein